MPIALRRTLPYALISGVLVLGACGPDAGTGKREAEPANRAGSATASGQAAARPAAMPSETKTFRDWFAVCDNGNDCMAFGPAAQEGATGWVRVHMPPGPDARPDVMAGFWPGSGEFGQAAVKVSIDGRTLPVERWRPGDQDVALSDPAAAVAALVVGRSMTLGAAGETQAMNLNGAAAALLWIDERQGRLDTVTALVSKGARPATAVPPAPPLPRVSAGAAVTQANLEIAPSMSAGLAARADVAACREAWNPVSFEEGLSRARLDERTELWGVACGSGAYNFTTRYFLTGPNGSAPRPLVLRGAAGEADEELVNSEYDPTTRTLSQFSKGRGIGDCGTASTWTWTGRAFVLSEETVMRECWGAGADRWPTTWRSRAR